MGKLPLNMRLIISRAADQPEWDLVVLLKAFDHVTEARERLGAYWNKPDRSSYLKEVFFSAARKR